MSMKIGALIVDLQGVQPDAEEKELLSHPLVGGVILFSRNFESLSQLQSLCSAMRAARKQPLLIMVDQEGGRVQRFRQDFYALPKLSLLGEQYDKHPETALEQSKKHGFLMAGEIIAAGLDLSLAPVVDLYHPQASAIGDRAFHADPEIVFRLASAYIQGMREAGMSAVIKHFPGHGSVTADSHHAIPVDDRELQVILEQDMQPFVKLIRAGIPAVLAAHIKFPRIDAPQVTFSRIWLQDILRQRLGFEGIIISDDLNMQGADISTNYADRVLAAREAGCDIVLLCNHRHGVIQVLDGVRADEHQLTVNKWRPLQRKIIN